MGAVIMIKKKVLVKNPIGVHLRPAGEIAEAAIKYKKCEIYLSSGGRTVNGKSLLSILSLGIKQNTEFEIICDGEDEEAALEAIIASLGTDL
jgi:phosphocarrier protein